MVLSCYDYLPFGQELLAGTDGRPGCFASAPDSFNVKFTGKERDSETGLDYFGARYMSSAQGRFTSPDRVFADQHLGEPQSWNLYAYVRNNPTNLVDDLGRAAADAPKKTLLDLIKFSAKQIAGKAGAGKLIDAPILQAFGARSMVPVFPGGLDKGRELDEAFRAADFSGMTFVGVPRRDFPGIDGIFLKPTLLGFGPYQAVPVSLKGFDNPPTPNDVAGAAQKALKQITNAQQELGVDINNAQVFIDARQLTADEVTNGSNFSKIASITTSGTVGKVVIFVKGGTIVCGSGKCK